MYLVKRFLVRRIPPEYSRDLSGMSPYRDGWRHLRNCILGLPTLLAFSWRWLWKRILAKRKLPSVVLHSPQQVYNLHFDAEQCPDPDNRVYLGDERDAFEQRRLVVDWGLSDKDALSALDSIKLIAAELERSGVARMDIGDVEHVLKRIAETGVGSHHIGATRMADDAEHGVVDRDCRVFGVDNLFIASSSTFPTASFANPTLTIVAMALRLADHLKRQLSSEGPAQRTGARSAFGRPANA
jgi:choline dehydrogenase-like flavoprotein